MIFVTNGLSRHGFLRTGTPVGGGLLLSLSLPLGHHDAEAVGAGRVAPNAFVRIRNDGEVVLRMPYLEMGEGAYYAIPILIAEELEVDLVAIRLENTPANDKMHGARRAGGSTAVCAPWTLMRHVGAIARTMLVTAAAQSWDVDPIACRARGGEVIHAVSGRRAGYGELATYAGRLPAPETVALKRTADFKLIGGQGKPLDMPARVTSATVFGIDTRPARVKIAALV